MNNNEETEDKLFSAIDVNRLEGDSKKLLEYVSLEMKKQFKKLHSALEISQQKFKLLKMKIYE